MAFQLKNMDFHHDGSMAARVNAVDPRKNRKIQTELGHTWSIGYGTVMECYGEECWLAIPLYLAYLARFWSCISDVDLIRFVVVSVSQYFSDFFHSHPFSSILIHSHPFSSFSPVSPQIKQNRPTFRWSAIPRFTSALTSQPLHRSIRRPIDCPELRSYMKLHYWSVVFRVLQTLFLVFNRFSQYFRNESCTHNYTYMFSSLLGSCETRDIPSWSFLATWTWSEAWAWWGDNRWSHSALHRCQAVWKPRTAPTKQTQKQWENGVKTTERKITRSRSQLMES